MLWDTSAGVHSGVFVVWASRPAGVRQGCVVCPRSGSPQECEVPPPPPPPVN